MNECSESCPMLPRIEALEEECRHNKDAHSKIYDKLESSRTSVAVIEERLNQIKEDTEEIKEAIQVEKTAVQELRDKPGKRWDGLVDKALWLIVGGALSLLLLNAGIPV